MVKPSGNIPAGGYNNTFVIIVAAGSGSRFGSDIPKQYLPLNGKPVLVHTIEAFRNAVPGAYICVVISESGRELWQEVAEEYGIDDIIVALGGASRTESVHNAISALQGNFGANDIVMIHDGARPLVNCEMIRKVASAVSSGAEAVVPVLPLTEAIAEKKDCGVTPIDRAKFVTVQTPQAFNAALLAEAYNAVGDKPMPDDAAIYTEFTGRPLATVPGHPQNIKITHPADIELAGVHLSHPIPYSE